MGLERRHRRIHTMDERGSDLWDLTLKRTVSFEELSAHVHPADRDRVRAAFTATRGVLGPCAIGFRILIGEEIRWIAARGQGEDDGIVGRNMFGVFLDVTGRKQAEEDHELVLSEQRGVLRCPGCQSCEPVRLVPGSEGVLSCFSGERGIDTCCPVALTTPYRC